MVREILFKAKRIGDGKWIEGDLIKRVHYDDVTYYIGFIEMTSLSKTQVIPETVSQFTGLYDKNGVRIFENDIVEYDDLFLNVQGRFEKRKTKSIVTFDNEHACFSPFEPDLYELYIQAENVEVIGSRFDNPELLKGK